MPISDMKFMALQVLLLQQGYAIILKGAKMKSIIINYCYKPLLFS